MSNRNEFYRKYYESDIFNANQNNEKAEPQVIKQKNRIDHPSLANTKEEVFNIGKEKRIKRNKLKREKEKEDFQNNTELNNKTALKRKNDYDKIYGSDIFNQRQSASTGRRRGVKQLPNITNRTTLATQIGDNEEYVDDLKYYTSQHRAEKKEYDPEEIVGKVTPQERYYREIYGNNINNNLNTNDKNEDKKLNEYIYNKLNLKKDINRLNNIRENPDEENYKDKRYFKQKPKVYEEKREFVDLEDNPQNNCRINKQIQMESHIFSPDEPKKDINEEVKDINDRLEKDKRKMYNTNIFGQPNMNINRRREPNVTDRNVYGAVNSKWGRTNIDWRSPESEVMFRNNDGKNQSARERKINQLSDSQNIDILSGLEKEPYRHKYQKEEKINNSGKKRLNDIIEDIPNINEGERLGIKMKASVLDCHNDDELDNKKRILNDYYANKNYNNRNKEVTGKVNERNDKRNFVRNNTNNNDNIYHDYVITYSTKGGNDFEKFEDFEIQKMFASKGLQTYDIHKDPFYKGNYNMIHLKIKGNDRNDQLYDKVKRVEEQLRREDYKINIEKDEDKNNGKNYGKLVSKPGSNSGIFNENTDEDSKYKVMPNNVKSRKGFTKEFAHIDMSYKRPFI